MVNCHTNVNICRKFPRSYKFLWQRLCIIIFDMQLTNPLKGEKIHLLDRYSSRGLICNNLKIVIIGNHRARKCLNYERNVHGIILEKYNSFLQLHSEIQYLLKINDVRFIRTDSQYLRIKEELYFFCWWINTLSE